MAVIGYDSVGALSHVANRLWARGTIGAAYQYTATAGDAITRFYAYAKHKAPFFSYVQCAAYTMAGSFPLERLHSPQNCMIAFPAAQWWPSGVLNIPLRPGQTYAVCHTASLNVEQWYDLVSNAGDTNSFATLTDPWDHRLTNNLLYSVYAEVTNTPPGDPAVRFPCCAQLIELP
jgi:hypothetical protein